MLTITAGFVLTVCSWFAEQNRSSIHQLRIASPVTLAIGFTILMLSCILCTLDHNEASQSNDVINNDAHVVMMSSKHEEQSENEAARKLEIHAIDLSGQEETVEIGNIEDDLNDVLLPSSPLTPDYKCNGLPKLCVTQCL